MIKRLTLIFAFVCFALPMLGQNLATVSGSNIEDLNGATLAHGQICFVGTDQSDTPISFQVGGGGQALRRPYCSAVTAGVIASFTVPNPALTSPSGIYYRVTVKDTSTGQEVLRYTGVTFSGGTFNFDTYTPNLPGASLAPLTGTTVSGNLGVTGNLSVTGTFTPGTLGNITTGSINAGINPLTAGAGTLASLNNRIYVDGVKYPLTHAGIQQALTDACAITNGSLHGTTVYFPPMAVTDTTAGGACYTVTCPLNLEGAGEAATAITATACSPMFDLAPTSNFGAQHWGIKGFTLNSGGGDVIWLDGAAHDFGIFNYDIQWNEMTAKTGSLAIVDKSVDVLHPTLPLSQQGAICHNTFGSGVQWNGNNSGGGTADGARFCHNYFPQTGTVITTPCLEVTTANGAANQTIEWNQFDNCAGGVLKVHGANQLKFIDNQVQLTPAITETNSAILDFMGDTFTIAQATIQDNNINALTSGATKNIRLDHVNNADITHNVITVTATTGTGISLTANSSKVTTGYNTYQNVTGGAVAWAAVGAPPTGNRYQDSSGVTIAQDINGVGGVNQGIHRMASNTAWCFTSSGDTDATAGDTCLIRKAAGTMCATAAEGGGVACNGAYESRAIIAAGTAATLSGTGACATITTQSGGGFAGRATCTGTTGASTLTVTPGTTAPHGWVCEAFDETTRANLLQQTSDSTTACVLTATSVTQNDVFVFLAIAF